MKAIEKITKLIRKILDSIDPAAIFRLVAGFTVAVSFAGAAWALWFMGVSL